MREKKTHVVIVRRQVEERYLVPDTRTPEEAESIVTSDSELLPISVEDDILDIESFEHEGDESDADEIC